jgi:phosphomannomutase
VDVKTLTEDIARRYAYLYHQFVKKRAKKEPTIVVGSDTRPSCRELKKAMIDSLVNVIDVGVMPTAAIEFAVREYKADGGIIITASHNEPDWNGFKFLDKDGAVLRVKDSENLINEFNKIKNLPEPVFLKDFLYKGNKLKIKKILGKQSDLMIRYHDYLVKVIGKKQIEKIKKANLKVLLDPNGGAGVIAEDIFTKLGIKNIAINNHPGEFKRVIEPKKDTVSYLVPIAKKHKAHLAAGFDCDADRLKIAAPDGTYLSGRHLLALAVEDVLSNIKHPEKHVVVTNDATSTLVKEVAENFGAKVKEVEVGEINVVDEMLKQKSFVGGEGSNGGVIVPPNRCRDGILTTLLIMNIMATKNKSLKELIKELPEYHTPKKNIKINPNKLKSIKTKIKKYYSKKDCKILDSKDLFGTLKIWIGDAWVFFRTSRTEHSVFRIITDAPSEKEAKKLLNEAVKLI